MRICIEPNETFPMCSFHSSFACFVSSNNPYVYLVAIVLYIYWTVCVIVVERATSCLWMSCSKQTLKRHFSSYKFITYIQKTQKSGLFPLHTLSHICLLYASCTLSYDFCLKQFNEKLMFFRWRNSFSKSIINIINISNNVDCTSQLWLILKEWPLLFIRIFRYISL